MNEPARHTITSALPYANGPLHIGHIAGAYLPADIYVRYLRSCGKDVLFICGSDEHGAAITIKAKVDETTPQEIVDKYHEINKKAFSDFGIDFDIYHRTSSQLHHETAAEFFTHLNDQGEFIKKESDQFYDEEFDQFLSDRYITGTCPNCEHDSAYGDQCEKCGKSLNAQDLIDPKSVLSGKPPILRTTTHWFLPLDKHQRWLQEWIETGKLEGQDHHDPGTWKKNVLGQCLSWIKDGDGLQPRSVTRDLEWGVKVPVEGAEGKVLYVWLDAPIGYISATKQWALDNGRDWKAYWMSPDTKLLHFIGKDNIVFHCIIFPAILKAHGGYILPQNVPANEFLNLEGDKLSTSRNWAVWLHEYLEEFEGKQDELRYVLNAIAPETKDSEFTWKDYQARVNNELVAILGNFVNRAAVLTHKYYQGVVPNVIGDDAVISKFAGIGEEVASLIDNYKFREAQAAAMNLAREGNKYLADTEPWKIVESDPARVEEILYTAMQVCANLTIVLDPFLPNTCHRLRAILGIEKLGWEAIGQADIVPGGHRIGPAQLLFQKIEDEVVDAQIAKLKKPKKSGKPMIQFDDFTKLDIRVVTIDAAEKVENADKLLKLTVSDGDGQRTVVSGIAEHYAPDDIIGEQVCLLANLEPRKIRGVESNGMILMAENNEGKLAFVKPDKAMVDGSVIR